MPSLPRRVLRRGRAGAALLRQGPRRLVAGRLAGAGLVDRPWYEAQSGHTWASDSAAALDYLRSGRRAGRSLHPLLEPEWIVGRSWRTSRSDPAQLYLEGRTSHGGPHPCFDDATYRAGTPGAAADRGGPLGHFLRTHAEDAPLPVPAGLEPVTLAGLRARLGVLAPRAAEVDWSRLRDALPARDDGLTSVVVTVADEWPGALALVDGALGRGAGPAADPVEVVIVERESRPAVGRILRARYGADPRVRWLRVPADVPEATAWNAGLAVSTGGVVAFVRAAATIRSSGAPPGRPWWVPLRAALEDTDAAAVGALVLGPSGTVASAGLGSHEPGTPPYPLLADHAPEDVSTDGPLRVAALGDDTFVARAADLVGAEGADAGYAGSLWGADLSLRLSGAAARVERPAPLLVIPSVRLVRETIPRPVAADVRRLVERRGHDLPDADEWGEHAAWARAGAEFTGVRPGTPNSLPAPVVRRRRARVLAGSAAGLPALRWAIKIAAPATEPGDRWGDVHFASDIAAALRRLGQHVVVDRKPAHARSTAGLDDVVLNLRGLATPGLHSGQVNLLWVISHPDQVSPEEVRSYDLAFAASVPWSRAMTERSGIRVVPLLQATDPGRFRPDLAVPDSGPAALFVGNSRGVMRPIVRDALLAGTDLAVYGTRWKGFIDQRYVCGDYLPNETVGAAYRAAGVVLNDHWPDMATRGFISNRVFDVVASGGRVVSDDVEGLDELFDGAVVTYRTPADLARLTGSGRAAAFPPEGRLLAISERIRSLHSFDARALQLLDAVLPVVARHEHRSA